MTTIFSKKQQKYALGILLCVLFCIFGFTEDTPSRK